MPPEEPLGLKPKIYVGDCRCGYRIYVGKKIVEKNPRGGICLACGCEFTWREV